VRVRVNIYESEGKKEKRKDGTQERKGLERKKKGQSQQTRAFPGVWDVLCFCSLFCFFG